MIEELAARTMTVFAQYCCAPVCTEWLFHFRQSLARQSRKRKYASPGIENSQKKKF